MQLQFIDLLVQYRTTKTDIDANIKTVLNFVQLIGGRFAKELAENMAAYVSRKHRFFYSNGTDAL